MGSSQVRPSNLQVNDSYSKIYNQTIQKTLKYIESSISLVPIPFVQRIRLDLMVLPNRQRNNKPHIPVQKTRVAQMCTPRCRHFLVVLVNLTLSTSNTYLLCPLLALQHNMCSWIYLRNLLRSPCFIYSNTMMSGSPSTQTP